MKTKNRFIIEFSLFSRYRTELMGGAVFGVVIAHFLLYSQHEMHIINFTSRLIYTQGLLFLSGFGLYYSYSNDKNIIRFYKKRINRLYMPFVLISFVFLLCHVLRQKESIWDFFAYLTTIAFWYKGNYYGMWYVAVSLLLYLIYPFIYKFLFYKESNLLFRSICVTAIMFILFVIIYKYNPNSWDKIGDWISKTPMFPLGIITGYLAKKSCKFTTLQFVVYIIVMLFLHVVIKQINHCNEIVKMINVLMGMPLILICFSAIDNIKSFKWILSFFRYMGKYSLEIYLLHLLIYWSWYQISPMNETWRYLITMVITGILCKPIHDIINKLQKSRFYLLK